MAPEADDSPRLVRAGTLAYRQLLRLFPHDFQQRFADELEDDFQALSRDAWDAGGGGALVRWWAWTLADTARSLCRQWLRTPWIPVLAVSAAIAGAVFWEAMGRTQRPLRDFRRAVAPDIAGPIDSPALLVLMALMVLVPAAAVVVFSVVARLTRHHSRAPRARGRA